MGNLKPGDYKIIDERLTTRRWRKRERRQRTKYEFGNMAEEVFYPACQKMKKKKMNLGKLLEVCIVVYFLQYYDIYPLAIFIHFINPIVGSLDKMYVF